MLEAYNGGEIQQSDIDLAYSTLTLLEEKYVNNFKDLVEFTDFITKCFYKD